MAPELSSNWKKLQAKIQAESTTSAKRKADETQDLHGKRQKYQTKPPRHRDEKAALATQAMKRLGLRGQIGAKKSTSTGIFRKPIVSVSHPVVIHPPGPKSRMGASQSTGMGVTPKTAVSPSLALWTEDNDISPEAVVEAYGLGLKSRPRVAEEPDRPNEGLATGIEVGTYMALDCEMVGVGDGGHECALARVSVVDFLGRQVYDSFVRPDKKVTDWRTHVSGVGLQNMATARTFQEAQADVANLLKGRVLVGHDVKHDLQALMLAHPRKSIRDTALFPGFKKYGHGPKPSLRVLAQEILGLDIQTGQHSSLDDARVTMLLFRKHKSDFDSDHMSRFPEARPTSSRPHGDTGNKKKKKKKEKKKQGG